MQWGLYLLNVGPFHDPRTVVDLARAAEDAGWDGFFLADNLIAASGVPVVDTWSTLAAIASHTRRIRFGPLVTALPRRHLGKLARETVTLDHLSGGRLTLGVGSGDDYWREYSTFGPVPDARQRGAMLDEGLAVLTGLWSGQPFQFQGRYYQISETTFAPGPVQHPRIPIWVGGKWPHPRPFRRAAQWDGVCPNALDGTVMPEEYQAIQALIRATRTSTAPFDIVHTQLVENPQAHPAADRVAAYAATGVTWWLADFDETSRVADVQQHIRLGPPR